MMLNNYYNTVRALMTNSLEAGVITFMNGTKVNINYEMDHQMSANLARGAALCLRGRYLEYDNTWYYQLHLGSGGTAAALTDTNLEAEITAGLKVTSTVNAVTRTDKGLRMVNTHTVLNNGAAAVTIREVGYAGYRVLMSRCVLENPVTLQPGETGVITVTTLLPDLQG